MKKSLRVFSLMLILTMFVGITSCNNTTNPTTDTGTTNTGSTGSTDNGALPAPTGVKVTAHEDKLNTVTVTWNTGDDVAKYYWIYYSTSNDTSSLQRPQVREYSSSLWKDTGIKDIVLNKTGTYYFWVKAANDYGDDNPTSNFSAVASHSFTLKELTAPTGVKVTAREDKLNTVTVTWNTGDDVAQYYWIYYSTSNDTSSLQRPQEKEYSSSLWKGTGTTNIVLNETGTYYFWVKAANGHGDDSLTSNFSAVASYSFALKELTVPENLKAEKYESSSSPGIKLSWDTTKAPYYHIYWSTTNNSETSKKLTTTSLTSDTIYENVYKLEKGTTYYFWVRSANEYSPSETDSNFSSVASFTYN